MAHFHLPGFLRRSFAAAALLAAAGCHPFVHGNGVFDEDERSVGAFTGVVVDDALLADVDVLPGAAQRVVVSGDANVVAQVTTRVETDPGGSGVTVLRVGVDASGFDSVNPLRLHVTLPAGAGLELARARGGSRIAAAGVAVPAFTAEAVDDSTVEVAGAGGAAIDAHASGAGKGSVVDASNYAVQSAAVVAAHATVAVRAAGSVTGTLACATPAEPFCRVKNYGAGTCEVTGAAGCSP